MKLKDRQKIGVASKLFPIYYFSKYLSSLVSFIIGYGLAPRSKAELLLLMFNHKSGKNLRNMTPLCIIIKKKSLIRWVVICDPCLILIIRLYT